MIRKKYIFFIAIMLISLGIMQSCKTKREIVSAADVESKVAEELFVDVVDKQLDFSTFSSKLNLSLSSGTRSLSSRSSLKIIKDKAIQLSIQPLFGVEMLRLYIDKDSLIILDRMNKRYVKEAIADVKREYPVGFDFTTIQSLLTNRVFISGNPQISYSDFKNFSTKQLSEKYYIIESVDKKSGIEYSFSIDGNDHIAITQMSEPRRQYQLNWGYDEFIKDNSKLFPHKMSIDFVTPKRKSNVGLEFSGITLDEVFSLDVSIPNSYARAYISDIIKIITSI